MVEYLAARGDVNADRRVILGYPTAEGLYGVPAGILGQRYLFSQGGFGGAGVGGGGGGRRRGIRRRRFRRWRLGGAGTFGGMGFGGGAGGFF